MEFKQASPKKTPLPIKAISRQISEPSGSFLNDVGNRIFVVAPLHDVLTRVLEFTCSLINCDSCFIYLLEKNELVLRASKNPHPEVLVQMSLDVGQGLTAWLAEHQAPVVVCRNAFNDAKFLEFSGEPNARIESFLSAPILSRGRLVGIINMQASEACHFANPEMKLISPIALLVGAEIEIVKLEHQNFKLLEHLKIRKTVERAKGILQRDLSIDEAEAYRMIQKESQQRRKPMKEISEAIILNDEMKPNLDWRPEPDII